MSTEKTSPFDIAGRKATPPRQDQATWCRFRNRIHLFFTRAASAAVLFSVGTTAALILWVAPGLINIGVCGGKSVTSEPETS